MCWGDVLEVLRFTRVISPNWFFFELHMLFHPQLKGMSQVNSTLKTCSRGDSIRDLFIPGRWRSRFQPLKGSRELTIPKRVQRNCQALSTFLNVFLLPCHLAVNQRHIFYPLSVCLFSKRFRCWWDEGYGQSHAGADGDVFFLESNNSQPWEEARVGSSKILGGETSVSPIFFWRLKNPWWANFGYFWFKISLVDSEHGEKLGGGFKYFSFSPLFGEDSHFD